MPCISSHAGQYHTAIDSSLGHIKYVAVSVISRNVQSNG